MTSESRYAQVSLEDGAEEGDEDQRKQGRLLNAFAALLLLFLLYTVIAHALGTGARQPSDWTPVLRPVCPTTRVLLAVQYLCGRASIHGLWLDPADLCTYCHVNGTLPAFSVNNFSNDTLAALRTHWPTCTGGSDEEFWVHEWEKHGSCTGLSQQDYFALGLRMFLEDESACAEEGYGRTEQTASKECRLCWDPTMESFEGVCTY